MKPLVIFLSIFSLSISINIDDAVKHLETHAQQSSKGYCARYVANALVAGGFKFARQESAYMYHSNRLPI